MGLTFREQAAIAVLGGLLSSNDSADADELAVAYAQSPADTACREWGHDYDQDLPRKCARCGEREPKTDEDE